MTERALDPEIEENARKLGAFLSPERQELAEEKLWGKEDPSRSSTAWRRGVGRPRGSRTRRKEAEE